MPVTAFGAVSVRAAPDEEPAVLRDHAVDRPHSRHLVAPAGRRGGDRNHADAARLQPLERRIGLRGQTTAMGQRFVHVGQQESNGREGVGGGQGERLHGLGE